MFLKRSGFGFVIARVCATFIGLINLINTASAIEQWKIDVDGTERQAMVCAPSKSKAGDANAKKRALVFAFHGHGGNSRLAQGSFEMDRKLPDAIVVYPQGLPTPGVITDLDGKRNGWQHSIGHMQDRDLKFFDTLLEKLKSDYVIDEERIYSMGHSNGGAFTYLLWEARPDVFAAFAPSAAAAMQSASKLKPKPMFHVAGMTDELVRFRWQINTIQQVMKVNQCEEDKIDEIPGIMTFDSKIGAPVTVLIHEGGHQFPREAALAIAKYFKEEPWKSEPVKESSESIKESK